MFANLVSHYSENARVGEIRDLNLDLFIFFFQLPDLLAKLLTITADENSRHLLLINWNVSTHNGTLKSFNQV